MTNQFLTGVVRGLYNNETIHINRDCFGPRWVTKANQFTAMIEDNIWDNIILELCLTY